MRRVGACVGEWTKKQTGSEIMQYQMPRGKGRAADARLSTNSHHSEPLWKVLIYLGNLREPWTECDWPLASRRLSPRSRAAAPRARSGRGVETLVQWWGPETSPSNNGRRSPRHIGHSAQRLSHGTTHSVQKEWPQGNRSGLRLIDVQQIAHSSSSFSLATSLALADHCAINASISTDEKPRAILFSPAPSSYDIRPSSTDDRGPTDLDVLCACLR